MHELRRLAYLDALGIDSYVSRAQLPGAAVTRRLAIVSPPRATPAAEPQHLPRSLAASRLPRIEEVGSRGDSGGTAQIDNALPLPPGMQEAPHPTLSVPRFSLTAIVAGNWLWLEELADMPLTMDQVQLVQSMARALSLSNGLRESVATAGVKPEVAQFDWPIHTNRQLDLGEEAARAGVAGFVGRKLEQHGCSGLVLLGQPCAMRVPLEAMAIQTVNTASSAEILASPALKPQVWRDLWPLVGAP